MAKFAKGDGRPRRPKGTPNKLTTVFKEAVIRAYEGIGGDETFTQWAAENQTEFYKIAARLIPQEVAVQGEMRPLVIDLVTADDIAKRHASDAEPADD